MTSTRLSIGSDPELILLNKNEDIICAGDVIADKASKFGVDGHKFIAELRPTAAIHPRDFVSSIRDVLKSRVKELKKYTWRAGPWAAGKPLGGHIHFGVPLEDRFRDALDGQFAPILALVEPQAEAAKRRSTVFYGDHPYGLLSDTRSKKWGFEYRTPSSFITSPGVSLGLLTIAKAIIWEEMCNGKKAFSNLTTKNREDLSFDRADFYNCKREIFLPKLELLESQLTQMTYFDKKQEGHDLWPSVSYILHHVIPKKGYNYKEDIKTKWKLDTGLDSEYVESLPPIWKELIKNRQAQDWYSQVNLPEQAEQFVIKAVKTNDVNLSLSLNDEPKYKWKPITPDELWASLA